MRLSNLVVQLGRVGDILNIIPACVALGHYCLLVHKSYGNLMASFPYLKVWYWQGDMEDLAGAVESAKQMADTVLVPQLFGMRQPADLPPRTRPSFVMDHWDRLHPGFGDKWGTLPLIVQRNEARECAMMERLQHRFRHRPLLVNLMGKSGPYPHAGALYRHLFDRWVDLFSIVELDHFRTEYFCDLLRLYDCAAGLITIDTATLHLARAASRLKAFQLVRPGCDGTPPIYPDNQEYGVENFTSIDSFLGTLEV